MSERGHEQHHQDVGAYLLGSLSEIEATAFKRHLMRCERCANELERLTVAVDALPRAVEPVEPPPSLKPALMQIVRREAPAPAAA
ncbi:MAG: zf-HC2 domain-containing protein, partial [Thermoleophilaceae bacterium]|nr:zf-HC2 domain-containing protein [Thermoleophilaceae bacterium]